MSKYIIENPVLLKSWDYEKNEPLNLFPDFLKDQSNIRVWWKCENGHPSFIMPVNKRSMGQGCPICSNHKIVKGINDFESNNPELMKEWIWKKNDENHLDPATVSSGSGRIAWWRCAKGHEWQASIVNRAKKKSGCPYCANLRTLVGFNDLATIRPDLAAEWDYEKNGDLTPTSVVAYYSKKVWWKCSKCGKSWESSPNQRSRTGCPYCSHPSKIADKDNNLEAKYPEIVKEWDYDKNIGIVPSQFYPGSEKKVWWKCENGHEWQAIINSRVRGRGCPYCSNKKVLQGFNDLRTTNPEVALEWDYEKNYPLTPAEITSGSNKKVWWICSECGHEWQAMIYTRAKGYGCPACGIEQSKIARMKTMATKNPLFGNYPELEKEWDFDKNINLDISLLAASSNKFAWWKCEKGHSFRTRISSRTLNNVGCPYCHNQKVLTGINDLETINPDLAAEWDYEKNYPLRPSDVFSHGSKHVWWTCPICGNSWKAKIHNRANGRGCPKCNPNGTSFIEQTLFFYINEVFPDAKNRYILKGIELDIYIPSLNTAIEYDGAYYHSIKGAEDREYKKDMFCKSKGIHLIRLREQPLAPTKNAHNIICDCTNWDNLEQTCKTVIGVISKDSSIDICIKRDYTNIIGFKREKLKENSFGKDHPELLLQWDYEKNVPLVPDYFSYGSNTKVWWKCERGHEWQASISNRCKGGGCPICKNRKILIGFNDLNTTRPDLAAEWNYEKNGSIKPSMVTAGSNKKVWWKCEKGHEWQDYINNRKNGRKCPFCSKENLYNKR